MLLAGVSAATPSNAADSTNAVGSVLTQTAPLMGLVLLVAGLSVLVSLVLKV